MGLPFGFEMMQCSVLIHYWLEPAMPTLSEQAKKREERADKAAKALEAANRKAKLAAAQVRAAARASRKKRSDMIGDTILLAHEAGTLTPQEMAVIGKILAARKDKPSDWDLLADWLPAASHARPAIVPDAVADAAE
jgi:hypothetical protein